MGAGVNDRGEDALRTRQRSWPLLRRYGPDVAVLLGTAVFLVLVSLVGLLLVHSR